MPNPSLPGYVFDAARNRYFRVVQNGEAAMGPGSRSLPPAPSSLFQYMASEIAKSDRDKYRDLTKVEEPKEVLPSPCKTKIVSTSGSLEYEVQAEYWIHARQCGAVQKLTGLMRPLQQAMDLARMTLQSQMGCRWAAEITVLVYDEKNEQVLLGCKDGTVMSCIEDHRSASGWGHRKLVVNLNSQVTCIDVKSDIIAMSSLGRENVPAAWQVVKLTGTGPERTFDLVADNWAAAKSIFSCALYDSGRPDGVLHLALCCEKQIRFTAGGTDSSVAKTIRAKSDALAVAALHDRHLLLAGFRNGAIFIYDTRDPQYKCVASFEHGSTVTGIKAVGEHYVVVAGLCDKLKLYDIRSTKTGTLTVVAVLEYAQFRNEHTTHTHMDISSDGSLLAVTCGEGRIQIYDTWTGRLYRAKLCEELEHATGVAWRPYGMVVSGERTVHFYHWRNRNR